LQVPATFVFAQDILKFDLIAAITEYNTGLNENPDLTLDHISLISEKPFDINSNFYWRDTFIYNDYYKYRTPLKNIMDSLRIKSSVTISLLIDKSEYKLTVLSGIKILKEYPVMFGRNSSDDKLRQGDGCTPEGSFKVVVKYPHTKYDKFIYFDYPNEDSRRKHQLAKQEGRIPADAKIGGEIGIHGTWGSDGNLFFFHKSIFSEGCIVLKRDDLNELYPVVNKNTKIVIRK
jgi:murein L,D-transpeptidase YafK